MAVRLVAGRAGSGKTHWCLSQIRHALTEHPVYGPILILLVPEQAGLQMERALLSSIPNRILGRCEVTSFRQLARTILNEATGPNPTPISRTGRTMVLRHLIAQNRDHLAEFGKVAERSGFVTALARDIAELLQESVSVDQLQAVANAATEDNDPVAPRLHDVALMYQAYLDYLGSERVDPEGVLDLARARLDAAPWLSGARFWVDGFAGFTRQQVHMLAAIAHRAEHIDLLLLLDPKRPQTQNADEIRDDLSIFARTERTWSAIARVLHEASIPLDKPLFLGENGCPRFANNAALARLERHIFSISPLPANEHAENEQGESCSGAPVRFIKAMDPRSEVAAAIRTIVDLVQRPVAPMRYRDIAIVVRDLTPYHDLISAALCAHGIPFFIDRRRPTYHHPLVQLVRAVVEMHGGGPFDRVIASLLKTGLSGLTDDQADAVENHILAHGLISPETWEGTWNVTDPFSKKNDSIPPYLSAAIQALNESRQTLRNRIGDWWPTPEQKRASPACRTWIERLYELLTRLHIREQLSDWCQDAVRRSDLDEVEEHERVWTDLVGLLDELVEILGSERMSATRFREVLDAGLAGFTLGLVPPTLDQVLVSSIERSRHPPLKAMFILGFKDGMFPARISEDSILGDEERHHLKAHGVELARTRKAQLFDERMLAYIAVTRPNEFLWISHPSNDETGKLQSPSPYWSSIRAALPAIPIEAASAAGISNISTSGDFATCLAMNLRAWGEDRLSPTDAAPFLAAYEWARTQPQKQTPNPVADDLRTRLAQALSSLVPPPPAKLSPADIAKLWKPPYHTSVTRLEQFAQCPFQHFAARGLRLEQRAIHEVSSLRLGILYHTILEEFVNELIELNTDLTDLAPPDIADRLARLSKQAIAEHADEMHLQERDQQRAIWRADRELATATLGEQALIGQTPLKPIATEQTFGGPPSDQSMPALQLHTPNGDIVNVNGKIDRVDIIPQGDHSLAVVFDYKRSLNKKINVDEVYHGLALQLCAYLLVLREHGSHISNTKLIPGGSFYLPLVGTYQQVDHPSAVDDERFVQYKAFQPRGILDFDWINQLDPTLQKGKSEVFAVHKNTNGELGYVDTSDAVVKGTLPRLLDHVHRKMTDLATDWLAGNIAISPASFGNNMPCSYCVYASVCRIEPMTRNARSFSRLKRSQVMDLLREEMDNPDV